MIQAVLSDRRQQFRAELVMGHVCSALMEGLWLCRGGWRNKRLSHDYAMHKQGKARVERRVSVKGSLSTAPEMLRVANDEGERKAKPCARQRRVREHELLPLCRPARRTAPQPRNAEGEW